MSATYLNTITSPAASIAVGGSGITAGHDVLVIAVNNSGSFGPPTSMTDNKSQTYTQVANVSYAPRNVDISIWRLHNTLALASTDTITGSGGPGSWIFQVWDGGTAASALSSTAGTGSGTTAGANEVESITTGTGPASGDTVFAAFACENGFVTITAQSGWTNHFTSVNGWNTLGESNPAGSSGAQTAQATIATTNTGWAGAVITLGPAGGTTKAISGTVNATSAVSGAITARRAISGAITATSAITFWAPAMLATSDLSATVSGGSTASRVENVHDHYASVFHYHGH